MFEIQKFSFLLSYWAILLVETHWFYFTDFTLMLEVTDSAMRLKKECFMYQIWAFRVDFVKTLVTYLMLTLPFQTDSNSDVCFWCMQLNWSNDIHIRHLHKQVPLAFHIGILYSQTRRLLRSPITFPSSLNPCSVGKLLQEMPTNILMTEYI